MATGDGNMGDNEKLIKICETELPELQQVKPISPDDLDLLCVMLTLGILLFKSVVIQKKG